MHKTFFLKPLFIAITFSAFISCDNDSNEIGADIVGNDNFEVGDPETFTVNATSNVLEGLNAVETTDLPVNAIGIYNNPVFGQTKATMAVQVQLGTLNPTFDTALNPQIQSVVLNIPYFSTRKSTNSAGESIYELDSIYGPTNSKIKLRIYESNYYMREIDASSPTQEAQKYYSDQNSDFDNAKGQWLNDDPSPSQNDQFFFSAAENTETTTSETGTVTTTRTAPGMRITLNKDFFKAKIMNAPEGKLLNNNTFKEYFRGLYFSVENSGGDAGNLAMMNFKNGVIKIKYTEYEEAPVAGQPLPDVVEKTLLINLNGKSVNFFQNAPVTTPNPDRVYLKGGVGSVAVIDLFGRNATTSLTQELTDLRAKNWLVNDASLTFTIDNDAMGTAAEPQRIYLYDLDNKRPLIDYYTDINSSSSNVKNSKSVFGGIIKKTDGHGTEYKIRMTNFIRGLLKYSDSTNVRLGLVVTETINDVSNKKLKTPVTNPVIKEIPRASVMNPLGTILYGSGSSVPEAKRLKFKIYFTKPKQN